MIIYILKLSACLAVFMVFYKLVLEKENMHVFKRFYLLGALLFSIGIPFITFTYYIESSADLFSQVTQNIPLNNTALQLEPQTNYLSIILWSIYILGVLLFGFKFIRNLYKLSYKIKHNPKKKINSITNVLLQDLIVPHTFFNYIFFNKQKFESHKIPKEVFWHEETHAIQKHSIDVLFIEILQVLFWFNPLIYIIKHVVKLNHEFLADQAVLKKGIKTTTYQKTLLAFSSNALQPQLANAINYSSIKKRFTVMKTKTSKKGVWLRSILLLPILAILLFSFSSKIIVPEEKYNQVEQELISNQEKATKEQVKEYNALAKKYNNMSKDNMIIKKNDVERLKYLYHLMSAKQRKTAESFPVLPPPPPPPAPKAPKVIKGEIISPPPPLTKDATPEQKRKYKKAYKAYGETLKLNKAKMLKDKKTKNIEGDLIKEKEVPAPPPIPESTTPQEKERMLKVIEAYAKNHPESVTIHKSPKGELIEVVEMPIDEEGSVRINNKTYYFKTKDGETRYYDKFGEKVNIKTLTPPNSDTTKPTWLYINSKGQLLFDDNLATLKTLESKLKEISKNTDLRNVVVIKTQVETPKEVVQKVETLLQKYNIKIIKE